ncbi:MAG: hypothetical protein LIV24_09310 [Eubacterium sp.]|nr:hypothetical protein [Eubacterium sp.]
MEEPERFAEHIAIVNKGEIKAFGTADELKNMIPSRNIVSLRISDYDSALETDALKLPEVEKAKYQNGLLQLYLKSGQPDFDHIIRWVGREGKTLQNISLSTSTLDDVFVYLTGKGINSNE